MQYQKMITIHGLDWQVCFVNKEDPRMNPGSGEEYFGLTIFAQERILVRTDLPRDLLQRTLRHELCHAVLFSYGIDGSSLSEEGICNFVEAYGPLIGELTQLVLPSQNGRQEDSGQSFSRSLN